MGLNSDSVVNVIDLELYTQILTDCHSMAKVVNVLVRFFSMIRRLSSKVKKELHHLAFLTLAKTSQTHYPAKSVKSAQIFKDDFGLYRAVTCLDCETAGMLDVDESPVVISLSDKRLTFLLIQPAHT